MNLQWMFPKLCSHNSMGPRTNNKARSKCSKGTCGEEHGWWGGRESEGVGRRMDDGVEERVRVTVIRISSLKLSENKHNKCYLNNSWVRVFLWGFLFCCLFLVSYEKATFFNPFTSRIVKWLCTSQWNMNGVMNPQIVSWEEREQGTYPHPHPFLSYLNVKPKMW